ncbi:hypothetical protein TNIN_304841 [Trichonephila inaurata madagascariensis]|uniref:Uncharacterized protein n=1 Tax=Trichonephila inaurata madagascariensis TaxID=2747483 RepID=A0A8X6K2P6_9ARAC|nr:hypothetical protein TNIN_304841 [Trichonephila inaurata madagascariensis]
MINENVLKELQFGCRSNGRGEAICQFGLRKIIGTDKVPEPGLASAFSLTYIPRRKQLTVGKGGVANGLMGQGRAHDPSRLHRLTPLKGVAAGREPPASPRGSPNAPLERRDGEIIGAISYAPNSRSLNILISPPYSTALISPTKSRDDFPN